MVIVSMTDTVKMLCASKSNTEKFEAGDEYDGIL